MQVYIHLAEGFEEIEAITVVDVLRRVGINAEIVSVTNKREVCGSHNITVIADSLFENIDYSKGDMIVLPGGMPGTLNLSKHSGLIKKITEYNVQGKWVAAICAAPSILGKLGLLIDRDASCYPGYEEQLEGARVSYQSVVQSDNIITSRGPGTAIEFSLKIVEVLKNIEILKELKNSMVADT